MKAEKNDTIRDYISTLTGPRKAITLAMHWKDMGFEIPEWPNPEMKNGENFHFPLIPKVLDMLKARIERNGAREWFSKCPGATEHFIEPKAG